MRRWLSRVFKRGPSTGAAVPPPDSPAWWQKFGAFLDNARDQQRLAQIRKLAQELLEETHENEMLAEALEFYKKDDERSVEMQILKSVEQRPAVHALQARQQRKERQNVS